MGAVGCRCLVDQRRSTRLGHKRAYRGRRFQLGLAVALAVPALGLSLGSAGTAAPAIIPSSPIAMSSCALDTAQCEVEVDGSAVPDEASVRLIDGPVSIAPTRIIGITLVSQHSAHSRPVPPEMLHAYFRLPRLSRSRLSRRDRRLSLMVEARPPPHAAALPSPRPASPAERFSAAWLRQPDGRTLLRISGFLTWR